MHFTDITFAEYTAPNGVVYLTAPTIARRHAFTTRIGGVSTGDQAGLNLSVNRDADFAHVAENYHRLGEATGIDLRRLAVTKQVHGDVVRTVTASDIHTLGTPVPYEADGLVTNEPGLALICYTADCVPVLLCDDSHGVIAAVHCGWRSSVADILARAMEAMAVLGASPETTAAAVGPAIARCCFEVGGEVVEAVEAYLGGDASDLYSPKEGAPGKYLLDLKGANARRLQQLGVPAAAIAVSGECTYCLPEKYWSHRYTKGKRGNQGAIIVL
jgi:hypothetical protein